VVGADATALASNERCRRSSDGFVDVLKADIHGRVVESTPASAIVAGT